MTEENRDVYENDISVNQEVNEEEEKIEVLEETEENCNLDSENPDSKQEGDEIKSLRDKLKAKEKECNEYLDLLKRTKAEFDNYRKRTTKEKENIYDDGLSDAISNILPVLDNLERAVTYKEADEGSLLQGIEMVMKIFKDSLEKLGVEEILAEGQKFDPDYHNAVMHVENEELEENVVAEVLQKGYKYKDKIIRYSMVKVAN